MTSGPGSRRRALLAVLAALALAVAAERGRWFGRLMAAGTPTQQWMWVEASPRQVVPRAFYLARDFELDTVPERARLAVAADPEYVVILNGWRIGSAVYRPGSPLDVYDVSGALRRGRNRMLLELRSPVGAGGATVRLETDAEKVLLISDGEWRLYRGSWRRLNDLSRDLPPGPTTVVLGTGPLARWGILERAARPTFDEVALEDDPAGAIRWRAVASAGEWADLPSGHRRRFAIDEVAEFDFGRPACGYLHLYLEPNEPAAALVFFGDEPRSDLDRDPDRILVKVEEMDFWGDAEPGCFRYVTLVGLTSVRGVAIVPVRPESVEAPAANRGLLGLPMGQARSPLVEELGRKIVATEDASP